MLTHNRRTGQFGRFDENTNKQTYTAKIFSNAYETRLTRSDQKPKDQESPRKKPNPMLEASAVSKPWTCAAKNRCTIITLQEHQPKIYVNCDLRRERSLCQSVTLGPLLSNQLNSEACKLPDCLQSPFSCLPKSRSKPTRRHNFFQSNRASIFVRVQFYSYK